MTNNLHYVLVIIIITTTTTTNITTQVPYIAYFTVNKQISYNKNVFKETIVHTLQGSNFRNLSQHSKV